MSTPILTHTTAIARDQLKAVVERIEQLHKEREALSNDVADIYKEAKGNGFDPATIRQVVKIRKVDAGTRAEAQSLLDLYLVALGMGIGE